MKGCSTLQCLVKKAADWKPEGDDHDFELTSDYFLSGLGGYTPSWYDIYLTYIISRYGGDELSADPVIWPHAGSDFEERPFSIPRKSH